ncbi:hypothetical protein [Streptomyces albiflavescens]|nr:hypothetical protein [Streptomyces albiflavescens]
MRVTAMERSVSVGRPRVAALRHAVPGTVQSNVPVVRASVPPQPGSLRTLQLPVTAPRLRIEEPPHRWAQPQAQRTIPESNSPTAVAQMRPAMPVQTRQRPTTASIEEPRPPAAPRPPIPQQPPVNIDQLTDDIVRRIDHRITAHRERLGRI